MIWSKDISIIEVILVGIFVLGYFYYFFKLSKISKNIGRSYRATIFKLILRAGYLVLLVAAVLGPSFGLTEMEAKTVGKDVFICFDLSNSMNCQDVSPSRLDKAKSEMIKLTNGIKDNRIGLIIFSDQAYVQVPLSFDVEIIKYAINNLKTQNINQGGTNLSSVIELSTNKLLQETNAKERDKIAVIITDGEDFGEVSDPFLSSINTKKVSFTFIGIGTSTGAAVLNPSGNPVFNEDGSPAISKLNYPSLQTISSKLKGKSFVINNEKNDLGEIVSNIESLKSGELKERTVVVANNKYLYFLLPSLLLIFIDAIFVIRIFKK